MISTNIVFTLSDSSSLLLIIEKMKSERDTIQPGLRIFHMVSPLSLINLSDTCLKFELSQLADLNSTESDHHMEAKWSRVVSPDDLYLSSVPYYAISKSGCRIRMRHVDMSRPMRDHDMDANQYATLTSLNSKRVLRTTELCVRWPKVLTKSFPLLEYFHCPIFNKYRQTLHITLIR